ncbi:MAG: tRNA (adenosine(37)-N6)-threonylcarbamoyltransferase complex ATPase subunit type 1 TsaE [Armatimonadetes bacterium]|nr:tRNA (adenosine(37)-N6)-threonylcarbamoyltransferase complex ATPase subunit type 1 TsaE [Armatimonadota bacterium]
MAVKAICRTESETRALGLRLARCVRVGDLIALVGPLGAGKTCLVRGLAEGLGVTGRVASPSFIIARHHPGPTPLVHADAYRLSSAPELVEAGLDEWLAEAVVAVEWAERVADVLPPDCLWIYIDFADGGREATIKATGPRSRRILECLGDVAASD